MSEPWSTIDRLGSLLWDRAELIAKRDNRDIIEVMKTDIGIDFTAMRPAIQERCMAEAKRRMEK